MFQRTRKLLRKDSVTFSRRRKRNSKHRGKKRWKWCGTSSAQRCWCWLISLDDRWLLQKYKMTKIAFVSDPQEFKNKASSNKCIGMKQKKNPIGNISRMLWVVIYPLKNQASLLTCLNAPNRTRVAAAGESCLLEPQLNLDRLIYLFLLNGIYFSCKLSKWFLFLLIFCV